MSFCMSYVACDVSRDVVDVVVTTRALTIRQRYQCPNTTAAVQTLLQQITARHPHVLVGVESTALYHRSVVEACTHLQVPCRLINPVLTKEVITHSIRKRKTDRDDALVIAKLLQQGEGRPVTAAAVVNPTKALVRSIIKLGHVATQLTLHSRHVGGVCGQVPLPLATLTNQVHAARQQLQAEVLATTVPRRHLAQSLPGIGAWLATVILAELGEVTRFTSADAIVAYAGLDPRVKQSGGRQVMSGRLTKRGSAHLRWALFCAANIARQCDPQLKAYYQKKRGEGKTHTVAVCATAKKLTYRLYAVLTRGTPYQKRLA